MGFLVLKLEALTSGGILACSNEAAEIANRLNIIVDFEFDDVFCQLRPGDDPRSLVRSYKRSKKGNCIIKRAFAEQKSYLKRKE